MKIALLLAPFLFIAGRASAEEQGFHIHGFSPDGRYFAFEEHGGFHAIAGYWTKIRVIDAKSDRMAHAPFELIYENPDETPPVTPDEAVRAQNLKNATAVLRGLDIRFDDPGDKPALRFSDASRMRGRFELRGEPYEVRLSSKAYPSGDCGYGGGNTYGFKLVLTGPKGERVLHDENRVPASRGRNGCVAGYWLQEIRTRGEHFVVVLAMDVMSLEARAGHDHLAVGAPIVTPASRGR